MGGGFKRDTKEKMVNGKVERVGGEFIRGDKVGDGSG